MALEIEVTAAGDEGHQTIRVGNPQAIALRKVSSTHTLDGLELILQLTRS